MEIFSPDMAKTLRRFPLAILFVAIAAIFFIGLTSDLIADGNETFVRLVVGAFMAAIFSIAGKLWAEASSAPKWAELALTAIVPILVGATFQLRTYEWIMPFPLMAGGFLWLSIAPFLKPGHGATRDQLQDHFWWFNHRVVTAAIIALAGLCIISVGLIAIERSMALLFGLSGDRLFYGYLMPFTAMFLTPLYWFSTIPEQEEFAPAELEEADFLSRAIGFLGQFVLVPLLLIYTAILLAYAAQIVINGALPKGTLGWMILGYLVTGAATWLILHPAFMRSRAVVRIFQKYWFWLTIVPIGLYAIAVYTRIAAYGLTPERNMLVLGGIWAAVLTLAFLIRPLRDIRLIPGIAALLLLLASIGPWNLHNTAISNQIMRLETAIASAGWSPENPSPTWPDSAANTARAAIDFLDKTDEDGLHATLQAHGISEPADGRREVFAALNLPARSNSNERTYASLSLTQDVGAISLGENNVFLGQISIADGQDKTISGFDLRLKGAKLTISRDGMEVADADLGSWFKAQAGSDDKIKQPLLAISGPSGNFALLITYSSHQTSDDVLRFDVITGVLFTDQLPG